MDIIWRRWAFRFKLSKGRIIYYGFQEKVTKHKFQKEWGHTYEEAFKWRYRYYIEIMEEFSKYLGRKKLIEMIMSAVDDSNPISENNDSNFSFFEWIKGGSKYKNMMTMER